MTAAQIRAVNFVLDRSWTCRRWRRDSGRLAGEAVEFLQRQKADPEHAQEWRSRLASHLAECVRRDQYGNPVLIWILLNVVAPIVVRLVIDWWVVDGCAVNPHASRRTSREPVIGNTGLNSRKDA